MLLLLLLAAGPQAVPQRSQNDLSTYLTVVAEYRRGYRDAALREIRGWRPGEIGAAVQALRLEGQRMHSVIVGPGKTIRVPARIDGPIVEATALMHVEAGLLEVQSLRLAVAQSQLEAAARLVEWSRDLRTQRLALLAKLRGTPNSTAEVERALTIDLKIEARDFYVALGAATLSLGAFEMALPFAEKARDGAPLDPEALLVTACVKESLALQERARTHEDKARRLRDEAEALFRETVVAEPMGAEAHLHLGNVLIADGRPREAEPALQRAVELTPSNEQLYLASLFLGRAAELEGSSNDAAAFYRRALDAWPPSQAARLALARALESSAGLSAARALVVASLADSGDAAREPDPWWSYPFGPKGLATAAIERLWQTVLGRSFAR